MSNVLLPGQPIQIPRGPAPQLGGGTYSRDGQVRASVVGTPQYGGSVGLFSFPFVATSMMSVSNYRLSRSSRYLRLVRIRRLRTQ